MATPQLVEFLWFSDCPNRDQARALLRDVISEVGSTPELREIDATDPAAAAAHRFPGSPTIRVDGRDVDPTYVDPGDYTPRCRLYRTESGLRGLPERSWIETAFLGTATAKSADPIRGAGVRLVDPPSPSR